MVSNHYISQAVDGTQRFVRTWLPAAQQPRAIIHIAHGMSEHGERYSRLAQALTNRGWVVFANDHRGHGKTAQSEADLGWFCPEDSWNSAVTDLEDLIVHEQGLYPKLPMILIAHSMGSLMAQQLIGQNRVELAGVVLSGSSGRPPAIASLGRLIARFERLRQGARGKSTLLDSLAFGAFNKPFEPARTPFDWLSCDPEEVEKYINDPLCGFLCSNQLWIDMLDALPKFTHPNTRKKVPADLPIYIMSGSKDPVADGGKSVITLKNAYLTAGVKKVDLVLYPEGRHEMFNESNREQVTEQMSTWCSEVLGQANG